MFSLKQCWVVPTSTSMTLERLDDALRFNTKMLISSFEEIYLVLEHPASPDKEFILDLSYARTDLITFNAPLENWILNLNQALIKTVDSLPKFSRQRVVYGEVTRAGFHVTFGNIGFHYPKNADTSLMMDLVLSRRDNMQEMDKHCLVTVNGFVHSTASTFEHLYVKDGAKSVRKSKYPTVGILSFQQFGEIKKFRIQEEHILKVKDLPLSDQLILHIPELEDDRLPILVLGGYLLFLDKDFTRIGDKEFKVNMKNLKLLERFMESSEFIDLSDLGVDPAPHMTQPGYSTERLLSDEVIRKYFTLSQSFVVGVKTSSLKVHRHYKMNEPYPNAYLVKDEPDFPLIGGHGRLLEYWPIKGHHCYVLCVNDNFKRNYAFSQNDKVTKYIDATEDITEVCRLSPAYRLEIIGTLRS